MTGVNGILYQCLSLSCPINLPLTGRLDQELNSSQLWKARCPRLRCQHSPVCDEELSFWLVDSQFLMSSLRGRGKVQKASCLLLSILIRTLIPLRSPIMIYLKQLPSKILSPNASHGRYEFWGYIIQSMAAAVCISIYLF